MMMKMMNCFCGMIDRRKAFSLISSRDHCQRSSPSRISDTPRAGFESAQNLSLGFVEWSCAVVVTTTPRHHYNTLTANYKYTRGNGENLLLPIQLQSSKNPETFCCSVCCISGIYIKFWTLWKKNEPHSLSISQINDSEKRSYLNA